MENIQVPKSHTFAIIAAALFTILAGTIQSAKGPGGQIGGCALYRCGDSGQILGPAD